MKTILEYQNEYWYKQTLINEAFSSKILQEIRDQINDIMEANHKYNAENKWSSKATNLTFKSVFSNKWVKWSEIKDEDFTEYDKFSPEGEKIIKQITSNRSNSFSAIVILLNEGEDAPKYKGMMIVKLFFEPRKYIVSSSPPPPITNIDNTFKTRNIIAIIWKL